MADVHVRGLATVIKLVTALCKINAVFAPTIRRFLSGGELTAYNALVAACEAFTSLFPTPGADNDPGTVE